ncbi:hypothetical protein DH2020_047892 [Rehmannia glutinosa]|uniref:Uncharacterized protein n=1 Tax=Rehmannia glutinosa TaxID=99300 RepID=A0ABR0U7Q2_REHGL
MKHSKIIARKSILFLFISLSTISESQGQTGISPAGLLCISDCETCPVICSPPPSPPSPSAPPTPKSPPPAPPVHRHSPPPPQLPYYFDSPSPSSPPAHPPPPPSVGAGPPPPSVYVYNPGTAVPPPGMGQRNFSFPYYYFYASKASCYLPLQEGFILLVVFILFQVLYGFR